jgi:hypothetical protein
MLRRTVWFGLLPVVMTLDAETPVFAADQADFHRDQEQVVQIERR